MSVLRWIRGVGGFPRFALSTCIIICSSELGQINEVGGLQGGGEGGIREVSVVIGGRIREGSVVIGGGGGGDQRGFSAHTYKWHGACTHSDYSTSYT